MTVSLQQMTIFIGRWWIAVLWNSQFKKYSVTAPSAQILLGSDSLRFQHRNRTHSSVQNLSPTNYIFIFFKWIGKPPMLQSFPRHVHWLKWLVLFLITNNLKKMCHYKWVVEVRTTETFGHHCIWPILKYQ